MVAIRFRVDNVVDQVGARSHHAQDQEGRDHPQRRVPFAEDAGGGWRHEDEEILEPLPRARGASQRAQRRTGRRRWTEAAERRDIAVRQWLLTLDWSHWSSHEPVAADMVMKSRAHHGWK